MVGQGSMDAERERETSRQGKGKILVDGGEIDRDAGSGDIVISKEGKQVCLRGPITTPWSHGEKWKNNGFKCGYCLLARDSGGATRLRNHLAGVAGMWCHAIRCQGL